MTQVRLSNLGLVLHGEGDVAGAKAHYERALWILETIHGADHPRTRIAANNFARLQSISRRR